MHGDVRRIENPHAKKVVAVLEGMLERARAGFIPGLLFVAEDTGRPDSRYGIVGRFRSDPAKALGHALVLKEKLTDFAAEEAPDFEPTKPTD